MKKKDNIKTTILIIVLIIPTIIIGYNLGKYIKTIISKDDTSNEELKNIKLDNINNLTIANYYIK